MPLTVTDPLGRTWRIERRWLPRRLRWHSPPWRLFGRSEDREPSGFWDVLLWLGDIGFWILVIGATVVFFMYVGIPLVIFIIDSIVVLLFLIIGIIARVLFRRPWTVTATNGATTKQWRVVGWRRSGEAIEMIREQITAGEPLPDEPPA